MPEPGHPAWAHSSIIFKIDAFVKSLVFTKKDTKSPKGYENICF